MQFLESPKFKVIRRLIWQEFLKLTLVLKSAVHFTFFKIHEMKSRVNSFKVAFQGLKFLFATQIHAKIHLGAALLATFCAWYFEVSIMEWCMIIFAIVLVIGAEAFNTSIEQLTDLVSPDYHPLAGKAKDLAAGGVLVFAIGAFILGLIIFLPPILALF